MNRRWSRSGAILATGAVAALALAGCSSPGAADSNEPVNLKYVIWDENQKPAIEEFIALFEEENPNITVDVQVLPGTEYWNKMQTAVTSGSGADVFWMNGPHFEQYASNGVLAELDIDKSNYPANIVDLASYDGKVFGAPNSVDTIGVWYNKALFDAAGLAYPEAGWTWEDFQNAAAELTDPAAGVWGTAATPYSQMTYYNTIYQAGGEVISSDHTTSGYGSPEALEGIEFWTDLIANGSSPTTQQMTDTSPFDMWFSGKIAMFWDGSWAGIGNAGSDLGDQIGVAPLPTGPAGNQSVVHLGMNVANAKSPNVEAAKKFAIFASGEQAAKILAETGSVIPAFNDTQQAWVDSLPQYDLQIFVDAFDGGAPYPASKNTSAWNTLESEILAPVWAGTVTPEEGLAELTAKMQAELDKE